MAVELINATPDRIPPPTVITQVGLAHNTRLKRFIGRGQGELKRPDLEREGHVRRTLNQMAKTSA